MVRLDKLKRVDLLVRAFQLMSDKRLVIVSDGPEAAVLRNLSKGVSNIVFAGVLSEADLRKTLAECTATICVSKDEDFGMCAVESLAAGKPVIYSGAGGLDEILKNQSTGVRVDANPSPDEIVVAVRGLDSRRANSMRMACEMSAQEYSLGRFVERMKASLQEACFLSLR